MRTFLFLAVYVHEMEVKAPSANHDTDIIERKKIHDRNIDTEIPISLLYQHSVLFYWVQYPF